MKRKLFTFLIAICASANVFAYDFKSGDLYYNITSDTTVEVASGWHLFYGSSINDYKDLQKATIPDSIGKVYRVTSIAASAFRECTKLTTITIPSSVTSIGEKAFYGCSSLTSITIPNSVTSIRKNAFCGCSKLTSITIPKNVTSIGEQAFGKCWGLTSIVVEQGNSVYDSSNNCNAIIETATNTLIVGCQNTIIPNSVTRIGDKAFYYCLDLTAITIPESVTSIGVEAFSDCIDLTSITIPKNVTSIGEQAFYCGDSDNLRTIYCFAKLPPRIIDKSGNFVISGVSLVAKAYNVILSVPCKSQSAYYADTIWNSFRKDGGCLNLEYTVSLTCNIEEGAVLGAGTYTDDTEATIAAIPNYGYDFVQWSDGNKDNPRKIIITGDTTLTAIFAKQNATTLDKAVRDQSAVSKTICNGQVCILRDGKIYDLLGNQIQ